MCIASPFPIARDSREIDAFTVLARFSCVFSLNNGKIKSEPSASSISKHYKNGNIAFYMAVRFE